LSTCFINFFQKNIAEAEIDWEAFEATNLPRFSNGTGLDVILCEKGTIYQPEDGTVLHCLCKKQGSE